MADRSNHINYIAKAIVFRAVCGEVRALYGYAIDNHKEAVLLGLMGILEKRRDYRHVRGMFIVARRNSLGMSYSYIKDRCERFKEAGYCTHYLIGGKADAYRITEEGKQVLNHLHNLVNDCKVRMGKNENVMPYQRSRRHKVPRF